MEDQDGRNQKNRRMAIIYKADKSRNRLVTGSGLGLSIVKKIIDMHKGTITVHSKLGEGATFTVKLPS